MEALKGRHTVRGVSIMAQSFANVLIHLVFSTKHRHPWINIEIEFDERYVWD